MTKNYNLSVSNTSGSNINLATTIPEEVYRLLQLAGTADRFTLDITSNEQMGDASVNNVTNVSSSNPEDIMRAVGVAPSDDCQVDDVHIAEQQAEYDYGDDEASRSHEFDIKDYDWQGRADLPERLTSAKFGSNPLRSEMKESQLFQHMLRSYEKFLSEQRENEDGQVSPLTADARDEFDKDPFAGKHAADSGALSPLSTVKRPKLKR
jgi:hypothetical protein